MNVFSRLMFCAAAASFLTSCQGASSDSIASTVGVSFENDPTPVTKPVPDEQQPRQSPDVPKLPRGTDALVFQGTATAYGDAEVIISILRDHGKSFNVVDSRELDQLSLDQLADYGVIIWPGGYAGVMSDSLRRETRDRIREAVRQQGVSFVGFCAGAFIAISPDTTWGFSLVEQETLPYYHLEDEGISEAMVDVKLADGSTRNLVWWGGPYLPEFPGGVIARYSDNNQPAITQTWAQNGLMILAGPHPEAPADWRTKLGLRDQDGLDHDLAWRMIDAALRQEPMAAFPHQTLLK